MLRTGCSGERLALTLACAVVALSPFAGHRASAQEPPSVVEEVIVTATKRPRGIQETPLAVTGITEPMLEEMQLTNVQQLTTLHPSVMFDQAHSFQNSSLKIRGIGTIGVSRTFEGSVGVFVDDVYRSRSGMALGELLDIGRVEVMRGPQGTLFGKNTVAGAVSVFSVRPSTEANEGQFKLSAGNLDSRYFNASYNVALGEQTAMRFAGVVHQRDGSVTSPDTGDGYDEIDRYGLKSQFLLTPKDGLEILLIADYAKSDAECCWSSVQVVNGPTASIIDFYGSLNELTFTPAPVAENDRLISLNTTPRETISDRGISATINWDIGETVSLKSITALRSWKHSHFNADPDYVPANLFVLNEPADIDFFSQELNAVMLIGETSLLAGFYYGREEYTGWRSAETRSDADNYLNTLISASAECLPPLLVSGCLFPPDTNSLLPDGEFTRESYRQDSDNYAVFAHATSTLTERLDLVTGIRYSVETKDGRVDNIFWADSPTVRAVLEGMGVPDDGTPRNGFDLVGTNFSPSFQDTIRDEEWTGNLTLQYQPRDGLMAYAGYRRGYKAGGVNLFREAVLTDTTVYAPEFADDFEVGLKLNYSGGRAVTNIALFHTEFSDLQINFFDGLNFRTENTGTATSRGMEIENYFRVGSGIRIDAAATYLDARFDEIDNPFLSYLIDRDTPRAPDWSAVVGITFEKRVAGNFMLTARGSMSYTGEHYVGADAPSEPKVDSYLVSDVYAGVRNVDNGWGIFAWCRNCSDKTFRTIYFNSTFQPGSFNAFLGPPRVYGLTLDKTF